MSNKHVTILVFILTVATGGVNLAGAQQTKQEIKAGKEAIIKQKIADKKYVFIVQSVTPMRGNIRQLSAEYDLRVAPDSIISYLPYFGQAYSAPVNPSEGGIKFASVTFEYTSTSRNKGGWDITIKPRDVSEVQQLFFSIFPNGSATLQVISTNRQPISFSGYISERN
ncbi:MAG: hypothetical protein JWQ30_1096 [Sediminibacterium sp.]|nr:hypothetical protein [Sediminibacterium sp.]